MNSIKFLVGATVWSGRTGQRYTAWYYRPDDNAIVLLPISERASLLNVQRYFGYLRLVEGVAREGDRVLLHNNDKSTTD